MNNVEAQALIRCEREVFHFKILHHGRTSHEPTWEIYTNEIPVDWASGE